MKETSTQPGFLGIGAQRSGSTWLYESLKQHPDVWLTPVKEVHFFDRGNIKYSDRSYKRHLRKRVFDYLTGSGVRVYHNLGWDLHYFLKSRDINWYRAIFCPGSNQIAGEITPAYSTLEKDTVQQIHKLNPELKIIYLMRDPIERDWSSAIKGLARDRKRQANSIPIETFLKKINSSGVLLRGDYLRTLEIWESVFRLEHIHIDFMDEIKLDAQGVLSRIFRFLEISTDEKFIPADVKNKKNSTDGYKIPIPFEIEQHLARTHLPQLEILSQRFGGHTTKWLKHAQDIISRAEMGKQNDL
jgi:hypothetical protein